VAQLSGDRFAFGGSMLSVGQATELLAPRLGIVEGDEKIPLAAAKKFPLHTPEFIDNAETRGA
jgi:hypothetical protein